MLDYPRRRPKLNHQLIVQDLRLHDANIGDAQNRARVVK